MRTIRSNGGPLIGIDRDHMHLWTGIDGKGFIGEAAPFASDYEAAGYLLDGRNHPPCCIAHIQGDSAHGLLITMPNRTAVLNLDRDAIYIVQLEYGDSDWGFDQISRVDFDKAVFNLRGSVVFSCKSCTYALFDAAYAGHEIADECLTFTLDEGQHIFSSAIYEPDKKTGLILCKISKNDSIDSATLSL